MGSVSFAGKTSEKRLPQKGTNSNSVAVKTDMSMEFDFSFTKTLSMLSWDAYQSLADSLSFG